MVWQGMTWYYWNHRKEFCTLWSRGEGREESNYIEDVGNVEDFENVWIEGKPLLFSKLSLGEDRSSQVLSNQRNAFMKKYSMLWWMCEPSTILNNHAGLVQSSIQRCNICADVLVALQRSCKTLVQDDSNVCGWQLW